MTSDRILRKIERCLALSKSANQHEAGIAIRQAQALMAEHGLTQCDVLTSGIDRFSATVASGKTPPNYLMRLSNLINGAFATMSVYESRRINGVWLSQYAFIGPSDTARIAAYAFAVLERQLSHDRREFMHSIHGNAKRVTRIRRADVFAQAWVDGARQHIVEISPDEESNAAISAFKDRYYQRPLGSTQGLDRGYKCGDDDKALAAGYRAGKNAQLHSGIDTPQQREGIHNG
ncbi:DUF2786 domain-containing protein [Carnimonas bestiolae]|uniref:DUF2786 domain-containing protein n=1 Tax=Carnimonas bestiolae TaxID=3402172 RepID=UPI003EDC0C89